MSRKKCSKHVNDEFFGCIDNLIVGFGTAGGAAAHKLSSDLNRRIVVIEQGKNKTDDPNMKDPHHIVEAGTRGEYIMAMPTNPDKSTNGNTTQYQWGCMLAGTAATNMLITMRPSPEYYNNYWVPIGGERWSYKNMKRLFKENETFIPYNGSPQGHGPIIVTSQAPTQISKQFASAVHEVTGVDFVDNYNSGINIGVSSSVQYYINEQGQRSSMAYADFLKFDESGIGRNRDGNLIVLTESQALKVLFDKTDCDCYQEGKRPRAIGVQFVRNGKRYKLYAKQVDLAAGPYTPLLLQYSGYGPREVLKEANVPLLIHNHNVGRNLSMHRGPLMIIRSSNLNIVQELNLTQSGGTALLALPGQNQRKWGVCAVPYPQVIGFRPQLNLVVKDIDPNYLFTLVAPYFAERSTSSCRIILNQSIPHADINTHFYADGDVDDPNSDISANVQIYKTLYQIFCNMRQTKPEWNLTLVYPLETLFIYGTDNEIANTVRNIPDGGMFRCGCRMAHSIDDGVVDKNLNVFGIKPKTLKCIDTSINPFPPNSAGRENEFAIGLNCAEIILDDL